MDNFKAPLLIFRAKMLISKLKMDNFKAPLLIFRAKMLNFKLKMDNFKASLLIFRAKMLNFKLKMDNFKSTLLEYYRNLNSYYLTESRYLKYISLQLYWYIKSKTQYFSIVYSSFVIRQNVHLNLLRHEWLGNDSDQFSSRAGN